MKIWCETCNGEGGFEEVGNWNKSEWVVCANCNGKGYTDKPESVSMSFAHYKELKMAASKWRMIEWAVKHKIDFVTDSYGGSIEYIDQNDIDRLIELYKGYDKTQIF